MVRIIFAILLLAHGLIHLMGFAKAFNYADISQLAQPITKFAGALWGFSALLFCFAAGMYLLKKDSWWMVAIAAAVLSQILIITSWQDAKYGTAANVIIAVAILFGYADWNFKRLVSNELDSIISQKTATTDFISEDKIKHLPPIVQTWLYRSNAVGKPAVSVTHLWQKGEMRTSPSGKWMPVKAEQYFTISPPAFLWIADVKMLPFVHLYGRDKYQDGKGHMLIKAQSLFPVADAKGPETDQGTLLRYLSEIIWFPSAALENYISWEMIDDLSAKATMNFGGISADGIFQFSPEGDMVSFEADRYFDQKGRPSLERWHIQTKAWKDFNGMRLPAICEVTWKLKEGDFTWFILEIVDIQHETTTSSIKISNQWTTPIPHPSS